MQRLAAGLELKTTIPDVARQAGLLTRLADPDTWAEMTPEGLETVRARLRGLVSLIDREDRAVFYTNFQDEIVGSEIDAFPDLGGMVNRDQYRKKVEGYLRNQDADPVIVKIRHAQPLTAADLTHLEGLLFGASDVESREVFEQVYGQQENLATFIRGLVGLDQAAAQAVFARFLDGQVFGSAQIRFVQNLISMLTRNGQVSPGALYDAPFTAADSRGLDGLFKEKDIEDLLRELRRINAATLPALAGQGHTA